MMGAQNSWVTHTTKTFVNKKLPHVNSELQADKQTVKYWLSKANAYQAISPNRSYATVLKHGIPVNKPQVQIPQKHVKHVTTHTKIPVMCVSKTNYASLNKKTTFKRFKN